jgi:AraC-like DNA-binding protein
MDRIVNRGSTVSVFEQSPASALLPFVKRIMLVEFPSLYHDSHLPDIRPVAAFSLRGGCRIDGSVSAPPAAFTGLYGTLRTHEHYQDHTVLIVTFTPVGAAAFLRPSLEEFTGTTHDLAAILDHPETLDRLHEQLAESQSHGQCVGLIEHFLASQIRVFEPDPLVAAAVAWLEQGTGNRRIDELTRYIGLSQSALERRFRRVIGVSPKKFASLMRLQQAVRLRKAGANFAIAAQTAGYFDQSHFIKEFRRATGSPPEVFFRQTKPD